VPSEPISDATIDRSCTTIDRTSRDVRVGRATRNFDVAGGIKKDRGRPFSPFVFARGPSKCPPAEQTQNEDEVASIRTACVQALRNSVPAQSIHDERGDTATRPQRQPATLCRAAVSKTAGTAPLQRGGRGPAAAAGGDGGRHRTPGHGGRLPGVRAVAKGAGAVLVVAASPLVPRQWKRRRHQRLCFGDEPAAWPCGERDILAKSTQSTTANFFSSWKVDLTLSQESRATMGTDQWPCRCVLPTDRPFDHRRTG